MEDLHRAIGKVSERLRQAGFQNERAVCNGAVHPILQACGWDVQNQQEVWPEYTTEKNTFVDYALLINGIPLIFIEVKHRLDGENKRREALKQLLEYAFSEGVPIAILTDGDLWAFYWPAAPGKMEERLVAEVQLTQTDPAVCAQLLSQYLQKQGASSEKLLEKMQSALQARKIPLILKSIFHSPSDKLLDLLQKEAESRGYTSLTHDQIRAFLQEWMTFPQEAPSPTKLNKSALTTSAFTDTSPLTLTTTAASATKGYYFRGHFHPTKRITDAYEEIINKLIQRDPSFADRFSHESKGHKRKYLAKTPQELFPDTPQLIEQRAYRELTGGWYLSTNLSATAISQKLETAARLVGLPFDDARGMQLVGF